MNDSRTRSTLRGFRTGLVWPGLLLATLLVAGEASAKGLLRGRILDSATQEALGFASVVLESGDVRTGVIADDQGKFRIELDPGTWEIQVSFIGYEKGRETVRLRDGETTQVDFALVSSAIEMEAVEVLGDRIEIEPAQPSAISFDIRRLKTLPAFGEVDPIRTLQYLPGVQTISDVSSGLYVRGGGPDQTLVLLDDVTIYNPTHAFGLFSTFNADVVNDVTLYKGSYPARYNGRLGAVLDVNTKEGPDDGLHGTVGLSTITGRGSLGGPIGDGSWLVAGRRTYLDPLLAVLRRGNDDIPYYYFYDLNGKLNLPGGGADSWEWNGYLGQDDLRVELDADSEFSQRWGNRATSLSYRRLVGNDLFAGAQVSASRYKSQTDVRLLTTPFLFGNQLQEFSGRADLTWQIGDHRVAGGVQASKYDFEFTQEFNSESVTAFESDPYDVSLFVQDTWSPVGGLDVRPGYRLRYFSEGGRYLSEPRISAGIPLRDGLRLNLATGLYHQYLQLITTEGFSGGDFYLPIDDTIEPPRSWQSVVGVEWEPAREWKFTAEVYGTDFDNLVLLDDDSAAGEETDTAAAAFVTGTGWATGVELFAERRVGAVTGWVGYTLGWTRRTFPAINGGAEFAPKYDRRHDLNVVTTYPRGKYTFSSTLTYGTGQAFTPATGRYGVRNPATGSWNEFGNVLPGEKNSGRLLPYHRVDVSVVRDFTLWGKPAKAMLQIFNLYSRRNEWFVQYDNDEPDSEPEVVKQLPVIPSLGVSFDF